MTDTQIMMTRLLDKETHRTLRILYKHVQEDGLRAFVKTCTNVGTGG